MNIISFLKYFGSNLGDPCALSGQAHPFLSFPSWYMYLKGIEDTQHKCVPHVAAISDIWLIVAAGIDILLRVAAIAAVAMVIYGGSMYITSQGDPEKAAKARKTIISAVIGLAIAITASVIITFIAGSIKNKP